MKKKLVAMLVACAMVVSTLAGCSNTTEPQASTQETQEIEEPEVATEPEVSEQAALPKYVFLFIGDGMSYPQVQLTNYFLNASAQENAKKVTVDGEEKQILSSSNQLAMMNFPVAGSAQTYDSTSFAPDSASTATSIATGNKTWSGSINVSEDFSQEYKTIAEKLKEQKDYKIGIISTVNINHATPAAFYAHQQSRNSYYEIGLELIESNFDYFAGGGLKQATGKEKDKDDLYELAAQAGYTVTKTQAEAQALTAESGKVIAIDEQLADSDAMSYELDRKDGEWGLVDYVDKGIELLDNENGFFMMIEGGKIDWACHANDAASTITDTVALDNAVSRAIEFYNEHPDETLIIVTGDHETGGLTIGFAGTDYDTFLTNFQNQKISYAKYGTYEPLTVTITHILNNKSGINFGSYAHTGLPVEVFTMGAGSEEFEGYYDNTDIYNKLAALTGVN